MREKCRVLLQVYDVPEPLEQWHRQKNKLYLYIGSDSILDGCFFHVPSPGGLCALIHRQGEVEDIILTTIKYS